MPPSSVAKPTYNLSKVICEDLRASADLGDISTGSPLDMVTEPALHDAIADAISYYCIDIHADDRIAKNVYLECLDGGRSTEGGCGYDWFEEGASPRADHVKEQTSSPTPATAETARSQGRCSTGCALQSAVLKPKPSRCLDGSSASRKVQCFINGISSDTAKQRLWPRSRIRKGLSTVEQTLPTALLVMRLRETGCAIATSKNRLARSLLRKALEFTKWHPMKTAVTGGFFAATLKAVRNSPVSPTSHISTFRKVGIIIAGTIGIGVGAAGVIHGAKFVKAKNVKVGVNKAIAKAVATLKILSRKQGLPKQDTVASSNEALTTTTAPRVTVSAALAVIGAVVATCW